MSAKSSVHVTEVACMPWVTQVAEKGNSSRLTMVYFFTFVWMVYMISGGSCDGDQWVVNQSQQYIVQTIKNIAVWPLYRLSCFLMPTQIFKCSQVGVKFKVKARSCGCWILTRITKKIMIGHRGLHKASLVNVFEIELQHSQQKIQCFINIFNQAAFFVAPSSKVIF